MKNIDISDDGFPARLTAARERAGLSKTGLAEKAGLSYRTVHNLETGRLTKAQEKTLLLLCEVLGVAFQELVPGEAAPGPAPPPAGQAAAAPAARAPSAGRRRLVAYALALAAIAIALFAGGSRLRSKAVVEAVDSGFVGRDPLFGRVLWRVEARAPRLLGAAPWDSEHVLASVAMVDGGPLLCLDRRTGREVWRVRPDSARMDAAFERDTFGRAMHCSEVRRADIDGDRIPELLAVFAGVFDTAHSVMIVDRAGRILHQYAARGRTGYVRLFELDEVPGQEVVVTSTETAPSGTRSTIVVLDRNHFAGTATDAGDSSRARLVFAELPGTGATHPGCRAPIIGEPGLKRPVGAPAARLDVVVVCGQTTPIQLELDDHLELVRIVPNDQTRREMMAGGFARDAAHTEATHTEAALVDWTRRYLAGARRYVAGQRVPFAGRDSMEVALP